MEETGPCDEKFFCPIGSSSKNGYTNTYVFGLSLSGLCPKGHTCAAGTIAPTPCPIGTFNPSVGQTVCLPCTPGYFCDEQGMSDETFALKDKKCYAGYYCPNLGTKVDASDGSYSVTPALLGNVVPNAIKCPKGHYCETGSATPTICPIGYYEPREGSDICQECPPGYYCPLAKVVDSFTKISTTDPSTTPIVCSVGYCESGVGQPALCPDGSFSNSTLLKMATAEECLPCPLGMYCNKGIL